MLPSRTGRLVIVTAQELAGIQDRVELVAWLRARVPSLAAEDTAVSATRGGRRAALAVLAGVQPQAYERSRNFLSGEVTRLSPYLRHGVLTLAEVRDHALGAVREAGQAGKLINEFAWRDYWQRLYFQLGEGVWQDREAWKTGFKARDYAPEMPAAVLAGTTSLACMDGFSRELRETGYLHNHARMWMSAYLVHWLRVRWQAGARWFLEHLLDGDPASNNLSWQWVASTFSSKAYIFNRENLERYTNGVYCRECVHARDGSCPFEASYEELGERLFPRLTDAGGMPDAPRPYQKPVVAKPSPAGVGKGLVWVHTDGLNPAAVAGPALFVWDQEWLAKERVSLKRIVFLAECLQEMPGSLELRFGDPAVEVVAAARAAGAEYVVAQRTPDPRLLTAAARMEREMPVVWTEPAPFVEGTREFDLKRFSRYWQRAQSSAMQRTRG